MTEPEDPSSLKDLDARLKQAQSRQRAAKERDKGSGGRAANSGLGLGVRIAFDMLAALVVGVVIGLLLDAWLGTRPWMFILFFFLGSAAGMLNVYRTATGKGYAVGYKKNDESEPNGRE